MDLQYTDALVRGTVQNLIPGQTVAGTTITGTGVQLPAGVAGYAAAVVDIEADTAGTGSSCTVKLQSSPDSTTGDYTDIPGAVAAAATPSAATRALIPFLPGACTGPFIRAIATVAAGSGSTPAFKSSVALISWVP